MFASLVLLSGSESQACPKKLAECPKFQVNPHERSVKAQTLPTLERESCAHNRRKCSRIVEDGTRAIETKSYERIAGVSPCASDAALALCETRLVLLFRAQVGRVLLPPSKTVALVEFLAAADAKRAFKRLACARFQHVLLYLEWAPLKVRICADYSEYSRRNKHVFRSIMGHCCR